MSKQPTAYLLNFFTTALFLAGLYFTDISPLIIILGTYFLNVALRYIFKIEHVIVDSRYRIGFVILVVAIVFVIIRQQNGE